MKKNKTHISTKTIKLLVVLFVFFVGVFLLWITTFKLPDLRSFEERKVLQSTKIYDRTGEVLLFEINKDKKRTVMSFDSISRYIKNATVAIEDTEFYQHGGIKLSSIVRAVLSNIVSLNAGQGGSTITQQVIKNSLLTSEKTITRKIKEWVLAIRLEQVMNKDSILELYLNEAPYGGSVYGVEEAGNTFFGKSSGDLTLAEASYLAALPQAPTYYSPYGNNLDKLENRKNLVLEKMLENNFITKEEYDSAKKEVVIFKKRQEKGILAPHFVFWIQEYLENKYGIKAVEENGMKVITTLDYSLQEKAEAIVYKFAQENTEKYNAENASLVAVDPKTGGVLVMVGSRNYFDEKIDGNFNVALAHRQPGSSFKPFVYASALNKGYTPETVVFDLQTEFSTECDPSGKQLYPEAVCYMPVNYDEKYRGPISLRNALAQSINIPAIKVLYLSGINDSLNLARDMGITSLENAARYGLTLVLGGGEVSLLEMTGAYSVFANDGVKNQVNGIIKIEDSKGNILEENILKPEVILNKEVARDITSMLSDESARAPAFGNHSYLYFPTNEVAVKTGTTNDYKDAWIIGYTPNISVGAWVGNNNNTPMEKKVAGFIVAPLWNAFMNEALPTRPNELFKKNVSVVDLNKKPILRGVWQGGKQYFIDKISGKLATEYTPEQTKEERVVKNIHSILYWVNKNDPDGEKPSNPQTDPQFVRWEYTVRKWINENNIKEENDSVIPAEKDDVHIPQNFPKINLGTGKNTFNKNEQINIDVTQVGGPYQISRIDFYVNSYYIGSSNKKPFSLSFVPSDINNITTTNEIKAVGYDSVFNRTESSINITVN
ncbi:MAG: 1A family penicillin-binding protein [Parcubacteria group bacterium Athens0714_16]|nr:MAG: 1A family penicillin-binding protein [Parcubacteria group bacterium Athens0714_16]